MNPWWRPTGARQLSAVRPFRSYPVWRDDHSSGHGAARAGIRRSCARWRRNRAHRAGHKGRAAFRDLVYRNNPPTAHAGRAGEAYQMARLAGPYPRSAKSGSPPPMPPLPPGVATLPDTILCRFRTLWSHSGSRDSATACWQAATAWRQSLVIDVVTGYRPSLSDRARQAELRLQPGRAFTGVRNAWRAVRPTGRFTVSGRRDSGIDLWVQLQLRHRYRAGAKWTSTCRLCSSDAMPAAPAITDRGQCCGPRRGAIFPGASASIFWPRPGWHISGRAIPALLSTSRTGGQGWRAIPHGAGLVSHIGYSRRRVRSGWLDLRGRRTDYRLDIRPRARASFWAGIGVTVPAVRPGLLAGSRAQILQAGMRLRRVISALCFVRSAAASGLPNHWHIWRHRTAPVRSSMAWISFPTCPARLI